MLLELMSEFSYIQISFSFVDFYLSGTTCSQEKMSQFFFAFRRKLARMKTEKNTDKASKENRST